MRPTRDRGGRRSFFAPEVIQTSTMDCGPAALKCLLEGFGISVSYGRLREACQTSVDGTSIDTLEEIACELGLDAEQVMLPIEHALLAESESLPALVVVRLPSAATHFVVVWRRHGDRVQVMDPATGRRWVRAAELERDLYVHAAHVPADVFRAWAASDAFGRALSRRLGALGIGERDGRALLASALDDPSPAGVATLDAATRMLASVVAAGGLRTGGEAARALGSIYEAALSGAAPIPDTFFAARLEAADAGEARVLLRGAVLVKVRLPTAAAPAGLAGAGDLGRASAPRSPELAAALAERPAAPARALSRMLREDGALVPALVTIALAVAAAGGVFEAVLLRATFDAGRYFLPGLERSAAIFAVAAYVGLLALLEAPIASATARLGRHLELRMRAAYLEKLPRLGDRYFASRLASDMAERGHALHLVRRLPHVAARVLRALFRLAFTTLAIAWLSPASAPLAALMAALAVATPLALEPLMAERDLRFRTHQGSLTRFYLDALLGLTAIRAHNAARTIRREHEGLLVDWLRAGYSIQRAALIPPLVSALSALALATCLFHQHLARGGDVGGILLLVFWTLELPVLGDEIAAGIRQYPALRSVTMRLLELLGAPDESDAAATACAPPELAPSASGGCAIVFEHVTARAGGHELVRAVDLRVAPGEHVAIVGASGAGKSSLMAILLGWLTPAEGRVLVDGAPLDATTLGALRDATAWLDPGVHLWNRSLLDNVLYGVGAGANAGAEVEPGGRGAALDLQAILAASDLHRAIARMPDGLQTQVGEAGRRLSGGEGQRVRFARALARPGARLAILDEPFRGLDRAQRRALLAQARSTWSRATLFCVTHDVDDTRGFGRVLVVEDGKVVEDGPPAGLLARPGSRYAALVAAEDDARGAVWRASAFRRLRLDGGVVRASEREPTEQA